MADVATTRPGRGSEEPDFRGGHERAQARAAALGLPFDPLDRVSDDPELWSAVPLELLVRWSGVPVGHENGALVLAFADLPGEERLDEIEYLLGRPITR